MEKSWEGHIADETYGVELGLRVVAEFRARQTAMESQTCCDTQSGEAPDWLKLNVGGHCVGSLVEWSQERPNGESIVSVRFSIVIRPSIFYAKRIGFPRDQNAPSDHRCFNQCTTSKIPIELYSNVPCRNFFGPPALAGSGRDYHDTRIKCWPLCGLCC